MRQDADRLQQFYATPLGRMVSRVTLAKLCAAWESVAGLDVLGLGFATPFLEGLPGQPRRCLAAMPETQGALVWPPPPSKNCTVLVDEARLPLQDAVFDRVLLVHALEEAEAPVRLLREVWRVTAPEGRVIVVVANRAGLWALNEGQPFGRGRPYSRRQLAELLRHNLFEPVATARALYAPPWSRAASVAEPLERLGALLAPGFGGVLLMEAVKRLSPPPAVRSPAVRVGAVVRPTLPRPQEQATLGAVQHREQR